jgi:ketosteroid isomerase-like protein
MSQENVELVRRAWEAWRSADLDGLFTFYADDVVWDMTHFREWPDVLYEGHEGARRFLSEWLEVWDAYDAGVEELVAAPDGRVVALAWQRGKGRHSGLVMEMEWAQICTVRRGKVVRIENYDDRSRALEAVGLSEQDAHADS